MGGFIFCFDFRQLHFGIELSRRQTAVPQQLFDGVDVSSSIEHVSGKGVTQYMRANFLQTCGLWTPPPHKTGLLLSLLLEEAIDSL